MAGWSPEAGLQLQDKDHSLELRRARLGGGQVPVSIPPPPALPHWLRTCVSGAPQPHLLSCYL